MEYPSPIVRAGLTGALIILRSVGWREGASIRVLWGVHHQMDEATAQFSWCGPVDPRQVVAGEVETGCLSAGCLRSRFGASVGGDNDG